MDDSTGSTQGRNIYRFAAFQADFRSFELRKHGLKVKLQEQPLRILQTLLERPGELVTREELRQRLWAKDLYVDFERNLTSAMNKLRAALNDSAEHPRYIETLPRRGYRFIAAIEETTEALTPAPTLKSPVSTSPSSPGVQAEPAALPARMPLPHRSLALGIGIAAASLAVAAFLLLPRLSRLNSPKQVSPSAVQVRLVVLPFENLSGDPRQEYFSDGMTEELSEQLGNLNPSRLAMVGRTSAMAFKNSQKTIREIGKELDVDYAVEGSVRRSGKTVRITAQLLKTADESHVWAQDYDRNGSNLLALETEIAQDIASQVGVSLVSAGPRRRELHVPDPEALEDYVRGRYLWNRRDEKSVNASIALFEHAVRRDPSWAPAYAGLADAYYYAEGHGQEGARDAKVKQALDKALALDPDLAEAHATLGALDIYGNWDWASGEKEYRRAIELNPNYPMAHHWLSEYLADRGRFEEAISEARRAQRLDPLSPILNFSAAQLYYDLHQPDLAIRGARKALELAPDSPLGYETLGLALEQKGLYPEAIESLRKCVEIAGDTSVCEAMLAHALAVSGNRAGAMKILDRLLSQAQHGTDVSVGIALVYVGLGDRDRALGWLGRAYQLHNWNLLELKASPRCDPLRSDPRFQALLHRVGLPQ